VVVCFEVEWQADRGLASIDAELQDLEGDIRYDEEEIKTYGVLGPSTPGQNSTPSAPSVPSASIRQSRNELHTAAVTRDLPKVQELVLSKKYDINARTRHGWTALMLSAEMGFLDVVKVLLLAPNIDLNAQNNRGDTAIHVTAMQKYIKEQRCVETITLLALHGAKVDVRNAAKRTAWSDVSRLGQLRVLQALAASGARISQVTGGHNWSALHEAAHQGFLDMAQWLISQKIDTTIRTNGGFLGGYSASEMAELRMAKENDTVKKQRYEQIIGLIHTAEVAAKISK
jgi:ankyrin repeat protein